MHTFKDNAGRLWTIAINVSAIKYCRAMVKVDLPGLLEDDFGGFNKLLRDTVQLIDVIYVLCRDDAEKAGVSDEDFGRAMWGDAIQHAKIAFTEELNDFFPDADFRTAMRKVTEAARKMEAKVFALMEAQVDAIDVDSVVSKLIASSGSLPVSSDSTPDPSPSASST